MIVNVKMTIPGEWQEVWLYKDLLLLWDRQGSTYVAAVDSLVDEIRRRYDERVAYLAKLMLFRYDWKSGEQFRFLMEIPSVRAEVIAPFSDQSLQITLPSSIMKLSGLRSFEGAFLDSEVYANRVYMASTSGLFEAVLDPKHPFDDTAFTPLLEGRVSSVAAKYLSVNASVQDTGLQFSPIHLGRGTYADEPSAQGFRQVAGTSLKASFAARHLLNYTGGFEAEFLRGRGESGVPHDNARFDSWQLTSFDQPRSVSSLLKSTIFGPPGFATVKEPPSKGYSPGSDPQENFTDSIVRVMGNSNYRVLVHAGGNFSVVDLRALDEEDLTARRDKSFAAARPPAIRVDEVLATYAFGAGFIVEQYDALTLYDRDGSHLLYAGEAARVRTFPNSTRYKETLAIIGENEVAIVGPQQFTGQEILF